MSLLRQLLELSGARCLFGVVLRFRHALEVNTLRAGRRSTTQRCAVLRSFGQLVDALRGGTCLAENSARLLMVLRTASNVYHHYNSEPVPSFHSYISSGGRGGGGTMPAIFGARAFSQQAQGKMDQKTGRDL